MTSVDHNAIHEPEDQMSTMIRRMLGLVMLLSLCVVVRVSADLKNDQFDRFYYEKVQ
jgi:hypothetical protein